MPSTTRSPTQPEGGRHVACNRNPRQEARRPRHTRGTRQRNRVPARGLRWRIHAAARSGRSRVAIAARGADQHRPEPDERVDRQAADPVRPPQRDGPRLARRFLRRQVARRRRGLRPGLADVDTAIASGRPGLRAGLQRRLDREGDACLRCLPLGCVQPRDEHVADAAQVGRRRARRLDWPRGDRLGRRLLRRRVGERARVQPGDRHVPRPGPLAARPVAAWTGHELVLFSSGVPPDPSDKPYPATFARGAAYNPATDIWRQVAPLPEYGGAAAWDGREILVVGAGAHARSAFAYDPGTNRHRRLARLPFGLQGAASFWTGHRLLVWGGSETTRGLAYDPRADRWSVLPAAPLRGSGEALVWTGRSLLVGSGIRTSAFTPPA